MKRENKSKLVRFPAFRDALIELQGDLTIEKFAEKLGLSRATAGFYLNGERIPDALGLNSIANACGVSVDYLLGRTPYKNKLAEGVTACDLGLSENSVSVLQSRPWLASIVNSLIELEADESEEARPVLLLLSAYLHNQKLSKEIGPEPFTRVSDDSDKNAISRCLEGITVAEVYSTALLNKLVDNIRAMSEE